MSKYGVISGPYFPVFGPYLSFQYLSVFSPNTGKYGPEITPYLDSFHAMSITMKVIKCHTAELLKDTMISFFGKKILYSLSSFYSIISIKRIP